MRIDAQVAQAPAIAQSDSAGHTPKCTRTYMYVRAHIGRENAKFSESSTEVNGGARTEPSTLYLHLAYARARAAHGHNDPFHTMGL